MMYFLTTFASPIVSIAKKRKILLIQICVIVKVPQGFQTQGLPATIRNFLGKIFREKFNLSRLILRE